jgi:predicted DNA-binding transcriptional regulator YafY
MPPVRFKATRKRVAVIDVLLRAEGRHTLDSISKKLGVTVRTVCRDLAFMKQRMGLPIAHDQDRGYYYALPVAPVDFAADVTCRPYALSPASKTFSMEAVRRNLEIVHHALYEGRTLTVSLLGPRDTMVARNIRPYFFSRLRGDLYLFASRTDSDALMNIPVSTISRAEPGPEMQEPSPFGDERVRSSGGWIRSGTRHHVTIRFKKTEDWVADLQMCEEQKVERSGRGFVFHFKADDLEEVRTVVRLLGTRVMVEEPRRLRPDETSACAMAGVFLV